MSKPPQNLPPCLKLLVDCWEHILDYLSFKDIHSLGGTCKPLHCLAGYYFKTYYPNLVYALDESEICNDIFRRPFFYLRPDFYQFIGELKITSESTLDYILDAETFSSLKSLEWCDVDLTDTQLGYAQGVLKNIENVELGHCTITGNVFEHLAIHCPKLKCLKIISNKLDVYKLLLQHYPQLEHFELRCVDKRANGIKTFLEKHSKLKCFSTGFDFLWKNRNLLKETNVQLDMIIVEFTKIRVPFDEIVDFFKALYDRCFYKSLYLSYTYGNMDENLRNAIYQMPALKKLSVYENPIIDLTPLTNLNELSVNKMHDENGLEEMAKTLTHLERLEFRNSTIDQFLPFIRHSKRLKALFLFRIGPGDTEVLDLFAFNEERKKLAGACPILIGVRERVYLATKWCKKNLNLSHVKVERFY